MARPARSLAFMSKPGDIKVILQFEEAS